MRQPLVALLVVATLAAPSSAAAGYWSWGYNYVGVDVNSFVASGSNYWTDQALTKNSGGTVQHGGPSSSCYRLASGSQWWGGHPGDLGCGGYIWNYVAWHSGSTSYLHIDSAA
jgi:hypothetical protein